MKKPFKPDELPLEKLDWMSFVDLIGPAHDAVARFDGLLQRRHEYAGGPEPG